MPRLERHKHVATGGARFGSADNYTDITVDGIQTMVGTARDYGLVWLPASRWYGQEPDQFANVFDATITGATCTNSLSFADVAGGKAAASPIMLPTLAASLAKDTNARASTVIFAPPDAASSGSSTVKLYYTTSDAMATTGSMQVWKLHWQYFGSSTSDVGGKSGSILYGASMASTGSGKLEIQTLGQMHAFRSASPICVLQLTLVGDNASSYDDTPIEQVFGLAISYQKERLGVSV